MRELYSFYYKLNVLKIVLIGIFLKLISFLFLSSFFNSLNILEFELFYIWRDPPLIIKITRNSLWLIVVPVIVGPLVETLIYQYFPLKICQKWFRRYKYSVCITIVLTSIVFASMHAPRLLDICNTLISGTIYCFSCFVLMRKKRYPIFYTTLMHGCYNALAVTYNLYASAGADL